MNSFYKVNKVLFAKSSSISYLSSLLRCLIHSVSSPNEINHVYPINGQNCIKLIAWSILVCFSVKRLRSACAQCKSGRDAADLYSNAAPLPLVKRVVGPSPRPLQPGKKQPFFSRLAPCGSAMGQGHQLRAWVGTASLPLSFGGFHLQCWPWVPWRAFLPFVE